MGFARSDAREHEPRQGARPRRLRTGELHAHAAKLACLTRCAFSCGIDRAGNWRLCSAKAGADRGRTATR